VFWVCQVTSIDYVERSIDCVYLRRLQLTDQHWTVTTRVVLFVVLHSDIPLLQKCHTSHQRWRGNW